MSINFDPPTDDGSGLRDEPEAELIACPECGGSVAAYAGIHEDCAADRDARQQVADRYESDEPIENYNRRAVLRSCEV